MRIGLAYDLRAEYLAAGYTEEETAEFDRPDTIDSIEGALNDLGHETDRIGHVRNLVARLAAGDRWDLVFSIAEGLHGVAREAQVPAILDAYEIPYTLSDPLVAALTLHKAMTKRVLRDLGLPTPDFALVQAEEDIAGVDLPFPLFVKPVAEGTAKGITATSRVTNHEELARECRRVLSTYHQPALVEVFLPGREFTVGITGTGVDAEAVGTLEVVLLSNAEPHSYTYVNKEQCEELCQFPLADPTSAAEAEAIALAAWRGLGCRDAGRIDLRADAHGRLNIMEVNPLPGLHPTHSDLPMICTAVGMPYLELIRRIVDSARKRIGMMSSPRKHPVERRLPPQKACREAGTGRR
ncbi:MAG TPA: D-alanine--D-alanine ligase [Phycisphaerae bacterium]|nr:D-alanine--D-alanine ligase [Phycisphaerae bacterium]